MKKLFSENEPVFTLYPASHRERGLMWVKKLKP
jgi:hypothetical protein